MIILKIYLKTGDSICLNCESWEIEKDKCGNLVSYDIKGIRGNIPVLLPADQIAAIMQLGAITQGGDHGEE